MNREKRKYLYAAVCLLGAFVLWTAAVCLADVRKIGPQGSAVGLAAVNGFVHDRIGVHLFLYVLTDRLSLIPLGVAAGFALLGLFQWIGRKSLRKVDRSILVLGGYDLAVMAVYVFFEAVPVNCRPVLIDGVLEASYPSSTTVLVLCVMAPALLQFRARIGNPATKQLVTVVIVGFSALMVMLRLFSGVHWLSDIVGGVLLSGGLVALYAALSGLAQEMPAGETPPQ